MAQKKPKDGRKDQRNEPFKNFEDLTCKLLKIPKGKADEERRKYEQERQMKRAG